MLRLKPLTTSLQLQQIGPAKTLSDQSSFLSGKFPNENTPLALRNGYKALFLRGSHICRNRIQAASVAGWDSTYADDSARQG